MNNEWKTVYCGYDNKPEAIDTTSSSTTVYERRNFEEVVTKLSSLDGEEEKEIKQWKYEERTYPKSQYELIQAVVEKINLKHESEVIDKFTEELVEGGML